LEVKVEGADGGNEEEESKRDGLGIHIYIYL
jgi:hypothetical protein